MALLNSLRLVGHAEPMYPLTAACATGSGSWSPTDVTLIEGPRDAPAYLLKTLAPTAHPAETMVLIDVDMVVTRPLTALTATAGGAAWSRSATRSTASSPSGASCSTWARLERRPYVSSGLVVLGGEPGAEVLALWHDGQRRVEFERSWFGRDEDGYPFRFIDQDVLNAVLASRAADELTVVPASVAPHQPYRGLRIVRRDSPATAPTPTARAPTCCTSIWPSPGSRRCITGSTHDCSVGSGSATISSSACPLDGCHYGCGADYERSRRESWSTPRT